MPFFRNRFIRILASVISVALALAALAHLGDNPVQRVANTVMTPVFNAASAVITPVRRFFGYALDAGRYEKEIEALKTTVNTLKAENKSREEYIKENRRLKELLDLRDGSMAAYKTVTARVVSYEPNSWYDTLMLSKGTSDGISADDIVITSLGVVGRVTSAGRNWAKVSTLINISGSVGVKLSRTGDIGVVSGDANLAQDKNCRLEYLSNDKSLIKGDILVTSGLGGIYPPDLIVGKVTDIKSDIAGNLEYGVVEPSVDFSSLYEVLVITEIPEVTPEPVISNTQDEPLEQGVLEE